MPDRLSTRVIVMAIAAVVLVAAIIFGVSQCDKRRSAGQQSKVESSQADAQENSSADAINTVSEAGKREGASEELTRTNEREIRNAEGANVQVGSGVNAAGKAALCRREAYKDTPACKGR